MSSSKEVVSVITMAKEVSKVELANNSKLIEALKEFTKAFNRKDYDSKALFCILLSSFRTTKDKKDLVLQLGDIFNKVSGGNSEIIHKMKEISRLADKANQEKIVIKLDLAFFYNIKNAITTLEALNTIKKEEDRELLKSEFRRLMFECYDKDDTKIGYNNKVSSKMNKFRKDNNINEINGVTVMSTLKDKISKLSVTELQDLKAYIATL